MRTSEGTDKIYAALIAAQTEIGNLKKDAENPYYKSSYASLENVLDSIKTIYLKHGVAILQGSGNILGTDIPGINIKTRLIHTSGQYVETDFPVPLARNDPQAAGSASSYGRRYALKAIAALAEVDDDAQASSEPDPKADRTTDAMREITDSQLKELNHLFSVLKAEPEQVMATCRKFSADRTESTEGLMKSEATRILYKLRKKLQKQAIDE